MYSAIILAILLIVGIIMAVEDNNPKNDGMMFI